MWFDKVIAKVERVQFFCPTVEWYMATDGKKINYVDLYFTINMVVTMIKTTLTRKQT